MKKIKVTLAYLIKDGKVLLGIKKRGFGEGKINGFGGKLESGEGLDENLKREVLEESGVVIKKIELLAKINFHYEDNSYTNQTSVFLVKEWEGEEKETEEMKPIWFDIVNLPYDKMWPDDKIWLSKVLLGKKLTADFWFDKNQEISKYKIKELNL